MVPDLREVVIETSVDQLFYRLSDPAKCIMATAQDAEDAVDAALLEPSPPAEAPGFQPRPVRGDPEDNISQPRGKDAYRDAFRPSPGNLPGSRAGEIRGKGRWPRTGWGSISRCLPAVRG